MSFLCNKKQVTFESDQKPYLLWYQICTGYVIEGNLSNIARDTENLGWIESNLSSGRIDHQCHPTSNIARRVSITTSIICIQRNNIFIFYFAYK